MILIPVFLISILLTSISNIFLGEDNYKQILSSSELDKDIMNYLTLSVKDNLVSKSDELATLFDNAEGEKVIRSFIENIDGKKQFISNFSSVVSYINGKSDNLNLSVKFSFTEIQFEKFKQDAISVISDGLLSIKKCDDNTPNQTNCRSASLSTSDIVGKIKDVADKALSYIVLQTYFYAKVPISASTKNKIDQIKSLYANLNKANLILWTATIVLLLLILALNIYPDLNIFGYISKISFISIFFLIIFSLLFGFLWKRGYYLSPSQLGLSSDFSIDTSNAIENLFNNLLSHLFSYTFIHLIVITGILLVIGIISSIIDFILKKRENGGNYDRRYTINAFSKKENSINEK